MTDDDKIVYFVRALTSGLESKEERKNVRRACRRRCYNWQQRPEKYVAVRYATQFWDKFDVFKPEMVSALAWADYQTETHEGLERVLELAKQYHRSIR